MVPVFYWAFEFFPKTFPQNSLFTTLFLRSLSPSLSLGHHYICPSFSVSYAQEFLRIYTLFSV